MAYHAPFREPAHRRLKPVVMLMILIGCLAMLRSPIPLPARLPPTRSGASGPVGRETYAWRAVAIGGGGFITGQSIDPHGVTRLARTDVFGAYVWNRKLDRWVQIVTAATMPSPERYEDGMTGGVYEIAAAPSRPDRLYMAMRNAVFRSDDQGRHFTRAWPAKLPLELDANGPFRVTGPFLAVSPRNPDLVLLSTPQNGVWRSDDAGTIWTRIAGTESGVAGRPPLVWFTPNGARAWILVQSRGMAMSADPSARRFASTPGGGVGPKLLRRGIFDRHGTFWGADQEGMAVWQRTAGKWMRHDVTFAGKAISVAAVAVDPRNDELYAFTPGGRVYRSGDGGERWWPTLTSIVGAPAGEPAWLSASAFSRLVIADVIADPVVPGRMWASAGTGVFRADAPAAKLWLRWTSQTRGIEELVATGVAHPSGGIPVFTAWDFGIHARPDLDSFSTIWGPRPRVLIAAQDVAWSAGHPNALVTNATDTRTCCADDGQAVLAGYSRDGGMTWRRFPTLPVPPGTNPDDPWAMSFGTIAVSSGDPDNVVWVPAANRSPFYTKDNGRSWQRVVLPGETLPFTGSYDRFPYIRRTLAADPIVPGRFLLFHSGEAPNGALKGLWRTDDGGTHWARIVNGDIVPASGYSSKLRAMPGRKDQWFFTNAQHGSGDNALRRSRDGGKTWEMVGAVDEALDVAFGKNAANKDAPAVYIAGRVHGRRGIWRSVDDAKTWQMLADQPLGRLDAISSIAADPDHFGRVYLTFGGSGWIYGEPDHCRPAPLERDTIVDCTAVL